MSRMLKDPKSIGKLSTRRLSLFQHPKDKKISAALPRMAVKPVRSRISQNALLAQGKEDPLPYIKAGMKPLRTKAKSARNPEEQVFFVDGSGKKIGHCMAVQMDSPRHSQAGKLYNPSLQLFASPGKIRHQNSSQVYSKPPLETTIKNFKNFLQHKYVQEMQERRKGMAIIEYNRCFGDSVSSTANFEQSRYESEEMVLPVCSQEEPKPCYLSTSVLQTNQIFLRNVGQSYVACHREEFGESVIEDNNEGQVYHLLQGSTSNHISIDINFRTPIAKIKQILIEEDNNLHLSFTVSSYLCAPLRNLGSQQQIHRAAQEIFQEMIQFKPQLVSLKKFGNCISLVSKSPHNPAQSFALIWYFNGSFYLGGWQPSNRDQGYKTGIGLQYEANQSIYFGQFANNQKHGYGALKKGSGETYVGEWREGQREGWGKLFEASGFLSLDGNFEDDSFAGNRLDSRVVNAE